MSTETSVAELIQAPMGASKITDARYHDLLNSNEPPMHFECPFLQSALSNWRDRLAQHDSDDSVRQLQGHTEEREYLVAGVTRHTAILSPLRRMPSENLSEIFSTTLPSDSQLLDRGRIELKDSPWTLSHICGRWRAIALGCPSLWSFIAIDCDILDKPLVAYPLALLRVQLDRASQLRVHFAAGLSHSRHQIALLELLVEYSPLWVEANLALLPELLPVIAAVRGCVPILRSLWLEWGNHNRAHRQRLPEANIDCFEDAPALRSASSLLEEYPHVSFPAHQLTRYQLNGSWQRHVDILRSATNLVEARVHIIEDYSAHTVSGGVIELPRLRLLYISHTDILNSLKLPALRELGLIITSDPDTPRYIDSMVMRSSCILRELWVVGLVGEMIVMILRKHQGIARFVNIATNSADEAAAVISALSARDASGIFTLAPQLESVFFALEAALIDYADLYIDVLSTRWKATGCALNSAGLLIIKSAPRDPELTPSSRLRLDNLRRAGLDLLFVEGDAVMHMISEWLFDPFIRRL
ncbi:hypothetical protein C8F04DRAFT_179714 [Mycena alexandri]|uniref:F-box domain-containing protein n=1 Tax=Mycena alexandri TaxID=1745969 RepID=A0AAD6WSQ6_9AGAR|nr:hypothetical protein C8F04DRAFT_179714 [Mycena alexandri]